MLFFENKSFYDPKKFNGEFFYADALALLFNEFKKACENLFRAGVDQKNDRQYRQTLLQFFILLDYYYFYAVFSLAKNAELELANKVLNSVNRTVEEMNIFLKTSISQPLKNRSLYKSP
jgi:hypothetical protein